MEVKSSMARGREVKSRGGQENGRVQGTSGSLAGCRGSAPAVTPARPNQKTCVEKHKNMTNHSCVKDRARH